MPVDTKLQLLQPWLRTTVKTEKLFLQRVLCSLIFAVGLCGEHFYQIDMPLVKAQKAAKTK
jgi:hypothetical protein